MNTKPQKRQVKPVISNKQIFEELGGCHFEFWEKQLQKRCKITSKSTANGIN